MKVTRIMKRFGTGQDELQAGGAGDIVSVAGIQGAGIADTICSPTLEQGLPPGIIEPPTLRHNPHLPLHGHQLIGERERGCTGRPLTHLRTHLMTATVRDMNTPLSSGTTTVMRLCVERHRMMSKPAAANCTPE